MLDAGTAARTPIWRTASAILWPCETSTSTCRNFATIASGLWRFLGIPVLLDASSHTSGGPIQRGQITRVGPLSEFTPTHNDDYKNLKINTNPQITAAFFDCPMLRTT